MGIEGRVCIVTGAGTGIGQAIAQRFVRERAVVYGFGTRMSTLEETAESVKAETGRFLPMKVDVSSPDEVEAAVKSILAAQGHICVVVNNAARQLMRGLVETTPEEWDWVQANNLKSMYLVCRQVLPAMIAAGRGSIVNVSSVLGLVGDPDLPAYGASKGGIIALTKSMAVAYGKHGIRVNAICPGDIETPMVADYFAHQPDPEKARASVAAHYSLRRIGKPSEVASAALFLASDEASFITGITLLVDGGLTSECY